MSKTQNNKRYNNKMEKSKISTLTLYGDNFEKMELEFFNGAQWIPDPRNVIKNGFYMVLALIVKKILICIQ